MIKVTKNMIFMGPPGAGKGSVAAVLANQTNLIHISTGNIFREEIAKKSPLGLNVKELVEQGSYVPDDITNAIVKGKILELCSQDKYIILDGYPRTIDQAKFLDNIKEIKFSVIELLANEEVILQRLSGRRFCGQCNASYHVVNMPSKLGENCQKCNIPLLIRKDDAPEAIKIRLKTYADQTKPLLDYYKTSGRLLSVDGLQTPQKTADDILKML
ncbi:adenylate kinase family protein [Mycoplasmopsis alligatoris]|uniref:Adenylate kinase n=1 Tax=Mycoplasmopsis alligatoris A21JP2 TaxID=747682 RepID=D4XWU3_9BACT|nr:nucleoside monophosphate kinase [Mycoplasmopsis alligatoris]EFF41322.1 putative adenylate kinase [Mycoplasmopsis alligatoris A21JP2]